MTAACLRPCISWSIPSADTLWPRLLHVRLRGSTFASGAQWSMRIVQEECNNFHVGRGWCRCGSNFEQAASCGTDSEPSGVNRVRFHRDIFCAFVDSVFISQYCQKVYLWRVLRAPHNQTKMSIPPEALQKVRQQHWHSYNSSSSLHLQPASTSPLHSTHC